MMEVCVFGSNGRLIIQADSINYSAGGLYVCIYVAFNKWKLSVHFFKYARVL